MLVTSVQGATSVEVYGFTGWITTGVAYGRVEVVEIHRRTLHSLERCTLPGCSGIYLCWAYLPEQVLQGVGITYYPDKSVLKPDLCCTSSTDVPILACWFSDTGLLLCQHGHVWQLWQLVGSMKGDIWCT